MSAVSWVMIAYLIANASLLLSSSRLGDMLAPGRLFLGGMVIFSLASAACGFSAQTWQLILGRAVQGAGRLPDAGGGAQDHHLDLSRR